jgi:hypothetical protein
MRPIFYGCTLTEFSVLFAGKPVHHVATVRIKDRPATLEEAERYAMRDLLAMSERDLELLREIAKPMPWITRAGVPEPPVLAGMIQRVYREPRYAGAVHCPGCGGQLGKGESPSIGYVRHCHHCGGGIDIQFTEASVIVTFLRGK